ncbi:response regulator transcription factor [Bradyrhizobium sp. 4]|uniref:response regulator transcription factor n=1 Tax=unclassified Bradyrhizobium TaxID=2631580 RepID=UPI001FF78C0D|nr:MULTISPECIES: response regulator [unclassified Bradyrhizobium]MCK1397071.1 response regulator transcription factor [Bradyrhizobium sp. 39]MCK1752891.1 response regulator transcription factor [Bradyrhizobium sp. 135]UPJ37087.1 response regulator transcription factor [Bradyrhizobium sp. 4]
MTGAPVVYIVDDDASFRPAICRVLKASGYAVVDFDSAAAFLQSIHDAKPGCLLLDVQMPTIGGLELQQELAKLSHHWPIIFMTAHGDIPMSVRAIKAGAEDFLSKPIPRQTLLAAIERALLRLHEAQQNLGRLDALKTLVAKLTPRENEVFALMVRGKMNKQIAHSLDTSERTIKYHRQMIMQKLEVGSFAEAVSVAERTGILAPRPLPDVESAS